MSYATTSDFTRSGGGYIDRLDNCARCGAGHTALLAVAFVRPIVDEGGAWLYWATCPTTGDPILIQAHVDDEAAG